MNPITVSVPGKIHLMGEHAVVYGKPALIAAIDKRDTVPLSPREDKVVQIIGTNLQKVLLLTTGDILEKTYLAQKEWERFQKEKDVSILASITGYPMNYLVIAVGETLLYYGKPPINGFSLHISSDIPIGAGLGSSAAVAAAVASAISQFVVSEIDKKKIHEIAVLIEQKKHGNPSGGDPAAVIYGNLVWFRKESDELKVIQPVPFAMPQALAKNFYLVDTGAPVESSGEMVQAVRAMYNEKIEYVDRIFNDLEKITRDMIIVLHNGHEESLMELIKMGQRNLEKIDVVSKHVKEIIVAIENSGGVGKISGGGGKTKGTGHLVIYHKDKKRLDEVLATYSLQSFPVRLGAEGILLH